MNKLLILLALLALGAAIHFAACALEVLPLTYEKAFGSMIAVAVAGVLSVLASCFKT